MPYPSRSQDFDQEHAAFALQSTENAPALAAKKQPKHPHQQRPSPLNKQPRQKPHPDQTRFPATKLDESRNLPSPAGPTPDQISVEESDDYQIKSQSDISRFTDTSRWNTSQTTATAVTGSWPQQQSQHEQPPSSPSFAFPTKWRFKQQNPKDQNQYDDEYSEEEVNPRVTSDDESTDDEPNSEISEVSDATFEKQIADEVQNTWTLTLSMRFRDGTQREKFFITYMKDSNRWRHVTVSVDYGSLEEGSLEADLSQLAYQRDKNLFIYKAVRQSLDEIHFFDTVTNLRLETKDEQLHIHVAEDTHEIIPYPPLYNLAHLQLKFHGYLQAQEEDVHFDSHLSGFVYKVKVFGQIYVKKEIPSTDNVPQFLYEIEALAFLRQSKSLINLAGIVVATINGVECVTGVLLEYASGGALNDFFYEHEKDDLDWDTRMTWIRQVVQGIADVHEAGYVQGDCSLSNVVLDCDGNARIVDLNRRGCVIGWEPPEFRGKIQSGQRISMYIGVKSDLYQLGMVIWAIAMQVEEPDRAERPLTLDDPDTPQALRDVLDLCLSDNPFDRKPAWLLLTMLPPLKPMPKLPVFKPKPEKIMSLKDRSAAVTHDDVAGIYEKIVGDAPGKQGLKDSSSSDPFDETDAQLETDDFALGLFHQDSGLVLDEDDLRRHKARNRTSSNGDFEMTFEEEVDRKFPLPQHADSGFAGEALDRMVDTPNAASRTDQKDR